MSLDHEAKRSDQDNGQRSNSFKRVLGWLALAALAVFPFPWW